MLGFKNKSKRQKELLNRFGRKELHRIIELCLTQNLDELERLFNHPKTPALTAGIAQALRLACHAGDWKTLESIVEQIVGKAPIKLDHTSQGKTINTTGNNVLLYLPSNGRTKEEQEGKPILLELDNEEVVIENEELGF